MKLDPGQREFLRKRSKRLALWPAIAIALGLMLAGLSAWLLVRHPLLINPAAVREHLAGGTLGEPTLMLMAGMLPLVLDVCLLITAVAILFACAAIAIERRYAAIVRTLLDQE